MPHVNCRLGWQTSRILFGELTYTVWMIFKNDY